MLLETGKIDEGAKLLVDSLLMPHDSVRFQTIGNILHRNASLEQAVSYLRTAYDIDSTNQEVRLALINSTRRIGELDAALELAQEAVDDSELSRAAWAHTELGKIYDALDKPDEGLSHFHNAIDHYLSDIELEPNSANSYVQVGYLYERLDLLDTAIGYYREAVRVPPDYAWHHYSLGAALLANGQLEEGLQEISIALKLNPDSRYLTRTGILIKKYFSVGVSRLFFQAAIDQNQTNAEAHIEISKIHQIDDDPKRALHHANLAIAYARNDIVLAEAFRQQGRILESRGQTTEALKSYIRSFIHNLYDPATHLAIGNLYAELGDPASAVPHYRLAAAISDNHPWDYYALGATLLELEEPKDATVALQQALALSDPSSELQGRILSLIRDHKLVLYVPNASP